MDFYQAPGKGKQEKGRKAVDGDTEDIDIVLSKKTT